MLYKNARRRGELDKTASAEALQVIMILWLQLQRYRDIEIKDLAREYLIGYSLSSEAKRILLKLSSISGLSVAITPVPIFSVCPHRMTRYIRVEGMHHSARQAILSGRLNRPISSICIMHSWPHSSSQPSLPSGAYNNKSTVEYCFLLRAIKFLFSLCLSFSFRRLK